MICVPEVLWTRRTAKSTLCAFCVHGKQNTVCFHCITPLLILHATDIISKPCLHPRLCNPVCYIHRDTSNNLSTTTPECQGWGQEYTGLRSNNHLLTDTLLHLQSKRQRLQLYCEWLPIWLVINTGISPQRNTHPFHPPAQ